MTANNQLPGVNIFTVTRGLERADTLRQFVTEAAGPPGGAEFAVFGDLAIIDDMISDLKRVNKQLEQTPDKPLSFDRAKAVLMTLNRLEIWAIAVASGTLKPGGLWRL